MWFAGKSVPYYYGGHMLAALLAELTGTTARYAYNLALAGYYAAYVAAAYGLARAVAGGLGVSRRFAGGVTAAFVALASNLSPALRFLAWALPWGAGERLASAASLEIKGLAKGPGEFNYWFASRVIDWKVLDGDQWNLINEFPFFAFLNGDLHGHMMSPPFLLLAAALCFAYWRAPPDAVWRRRATAALVAPAAGLLLITNSWSYPAPLGLLWLTLLFGAAPPWDLFPARIAARVEQFAAGGRAREEVARTGVAAAAAVAVGLLGALMVVPYFVGPSAPLGAGFLPEPRSDLPGLLVVHGAFLAITARYLLDRVTPSRRAWGALAALFALTWLYQATAVVLFVPPLLAAWYCLRTGRTVDFEAVLLVGVFGLLTLVEFVYVVEQAGPGRSNTVFKVYAQVWALWSVAAGVALASVVSPGAAAAALRRRVETALARVRRVTPRTDGGEGPDRRPTAPSSRSGGSGGRTSGDPPGDQALRGVLVVVLFLSVSMYAGMGTAWQFDNGPQADSPTLDAWSFVEDHHAEELAALRWLDRREGQPTIASAPGVSIYQWVNAPSSLTGVPTVAGWAHEIGYRGRATYMDRVEDARLIFEGGPEQRAALLEQYDVEYIYVGPVERQRFERTPTFENETAITEAKRFSAVTIYQVNRSRL
jgi:YYY domain-containing protein